MAIPRNVATIAVIIALTASGCTQPDPNAKPTYACTPSDGGTARPCYKAEYDLQAKEDALYTEAEAVFRKFVAEDERIYREGGASGVTPLILQTTTGDFLKVRAATYKALKDTHTSLVDGGFRIAWIKRAPELAAPGAVVTLKNCLDGSTAKLATAGSKSWHAGFTSDTLNYVREAGVLKISSASGKDVKGC